MNKRFAASTLGWLTLGALLLLGFGGAASSPQSVWLGVPGVLPSALAGSMVLALATVARGTVAAASLAGLAAALVLLVAAPARAALLSGPPLLALALAGAVLVLWQVSPRVFRGLLPATLAVVYIATAARVQRQVGAEGDEPHYLMVSESLLRDRDLSLEADYALGRYRRFTSKAHLEPHYRVRGKSGEIYSLHAVGLSVLLLPAYAVAGYAGASFFMALLLVLLVREIRALCALTTGSDAAAEATAWLVGLSAPLVHYAGLLFTEVPAALLVALALRLLWKAGEASARQLAAAGAAVALLPWLNVRYAALALVLALSGLAQRPPVLRMRRIAAFLLPSAVSCVALALYHYRLYGFFDPRRVYGARPEFALAALPEGVLGLLLDQEFGLLVYAPVFAAVVPGLLLLVREHRRPALTAAALVTVTLIVAGSWHMWRGGFNPPARFLVPVVPALALALARVLKAPPKSGVALLAGFSLWLGLAGAWQPRLVHRDRDGTAPLFRENSGAAEWTRVLPAYVLAEPDRHGLSAVWLVALSAAVLPWRLARLGLAARLGGSVCGLFAALAVASSLSDGRSGGRDAVRLLDRAGIALRGLRAASPVPARWTAAALDWGPLYEPHRHAAGAVIGARLPLPAGRYSLRIEVDPLAGATTAPTLRIRSDSGGVRDVAMVAAGRAIDARFELPRAGTFTLLVTGGTPFVINEIRLERSTFEATLGLIRIGGERRQS